VFGFLSGLLTTETVNQKSVVKSDVQRDNWLNRVKTTASEVKTQLRYLASRGYVELVRRNYEHQVITRTNRTPAGAFQSYELVNRHGSDPMLKAMGEFCEPDATIYDIGANVGIYSVALASAEPDRTVIAFEPAPVTVSSLKATVACNDLADQVTIQQCGVGATNEERSFYCSTLPELSGFSREGATRWGAHIAEVVPVPVCRLGTIDETLPSPDVIKIDVEGTGPAVLRGAQEMITETRPVFFIEPHDEELSESQEMRELLLDFDYRIEVYDSYWRCLPE